MDSLLLTVEDPGVGWLSANRPTRNHAHLARNRREWHSATEVALRSLLGAQGVTSLEPPVVATWTTHRTRGGNADADNLAPTTKPILDALVAAGCLPDDHDGIIPIRTYCRGPNRPRRAITVSLRGVGSVCPTCGAPAGRAGGAS